METTTTTTNNNVATVQHVTKKSSDELLRKFADEEEEEEKEAARRQHSKRRKRREDETKGVNESCLSPTHNALVERRTLLIPCNGGGKTKSFLFRKCGVVGFRSKTRAKDFKRKFLFASIQKTWRRTLEGTSKVLLEKHYNRHRRLIHDVV